MAEIRIERKGRGLGWLWLLLALIIVAALAWYFLSSGRPAPATPAPATTGARDSAGPQQLPPARIASGWRAIARSNHSGGWYGQEG
jgi:hypothetical protein